MRKIIIIFLLIFSATQLNAQIQIDGYAPKYKGKTFSFFKYDDYITHTETELAKCTVDDDGKFSVSLDIADIEYIYTSAGKYVFYFFGQPKSSIKLEISEREEKTESEKLNPFFEPLYVAAKVDATSDNGFNNQLISIDNASDKTMLAAMTSKNESREFRDSLLNAFKNSIANTDNSFAAEYAKYRTATIEYNLKLKTLGRLQHEYFVGKSILYNNPAYCELYNKLHEKYFLHLSQRKQGKVFKRAVNQSMLNEVENILRGDSSLLNNDFRQLMILQNAYNEFYDSNFSRSALLQIIDSVGVVSSNINNKKIAKNIRAKITQLLAGYYPPKFELNDLNGKTYTLESFRGKYLYLGFFSVNSYGCLQDLFLIDKLTKKYGEKIQFVSICIDNPEDITNFLRIEKFDWIFLSHAKQPDMLKNYDIRTYPTYYLIDKDGKLLESPALSPNENVEAVFENLQ